jgi:hypothetical protein
MHLFGDTSSPHLAHFHAWHHGSWVELDWELRNSPPLKWRVLRSESGFAESADAPGDNGQVLVTEGRDTHVADDGLEGHGHVFYTVFAQDDKGVWQRQAEAKLKMHDAFGWLHPKAQDVYLAERSLAAHPPVYGSSPFPYGQGDAASACLHLADLDKP